MNHTIASKSKYIDLDATRSLPRKPPDLINLPTLAGYALVSPVETPRRRISTVHPTSVRYSSPSARNTNLNRFDIGMENFEGACTLHNSKRFELSLLNTYATIVRLRESDRRMDMNDKFSHVNIDKIPHLSSFRVFSQLPSEPKVGPVGTLSR